MLSVCWHSEMKYEATSIVAENKFFIAAPGMSERAGEDMKIILEPAQKPYTVSLGCDFLSYDKSFLEMLAPR